jgi:hypothetical protein
MPSFLELIITAVGTETAAASVGKVNGALGDMVGELGRVAVAALSVQTAYQGVSSAIGEAAEFEHLSMRTGESVRELVVLDQAFRNAHLGAEMIGMSANMLQRSLGGLNDMGGKTDGAFKRIGTSIAELKPLTYAQQLEVLSKGFANLSNQADKVAVARQLFGRGGGSMLQLLGDPEALELAKQQTGDLATRVDQNARAAENLEKQWNGVTAQIRTMWQAAATQLLPTLQSVASVMGGIGGAGSLGAGLAGMAPSLLGAGLAAGIIPKLDNAVLDWATRTGNPAGQAFAGKFIAPITGAMSSMLLPALAAVIAGGIVAGILNAMADANVQATLRDLHVVGDAMKGARDRAGKSGSPEEIAAARAATQAEMTKLLLEQSVLEKRKTAAEAEAKAAAGPTTTYGVGMSVSFRPKAFSDADAKRLQDVKEIIGQQKLLIRDLQDPTKAAKIISENQLKAIKASLDPLVADLPKLREDADKAALKVMDPRERLGVLEGRKAFLQAHQGGTTGAGGEYDEARSLSLQKDIADIGAQILETKAKVSEEDKKQADAEQKRQLYALETQRLQAQAAGDDTLAQKLKEEIEQKRASYELSGLDLTLAKQRGDAEHRIGEIEQARKNAKSGIEADKSALEKQLSAIRLSLAELEADYDHTEAEKWAKKQELIDKEIEKLTAEKKAAEALRDAETDKPTRALYDQTATGLGDKLDNAKSEKGRQGANPNSIGAQLTVASKAVEDGMGATAKQIGKAWQTTAETMRTSMGSSLYDMMARTKNFKDAAGALYISMAQSLGHTTAQMAADWFMKHVIMDNARRLFHALGLVEEKAATGAQVGVHATGELAKTGATGAGVVARSAARLTETVFHGIMVGIRTALHIAGEVAQTAATIAQSALRIAATIAESLVSIIKAAAGAMSAMASIPYVGPILAIAAAAAMIAEGSSLIKGAREFGGPVEGGQAYLVGERRPEVFVPHTDGFILPDASRFAYSAPALSRGSSSASASSARSVSAASASSGQSAGRSAPPNVHIYLDKSAYLAAIASDMSGIAHQVYDKRARS